VLIDTMHDHLSMIGFVIITLLLLAGPLAYFAGVDSRKDEHSRRDLRV
jgi:hypothetical protein